MHTEQKRIASRLEEIADAFQELSVRVSQPEVVADAKLYSELMRKYAQMEPLNALAQGYLKLLTDIESARSLLDDPDLGELARQELDELEAALPERTREARIALLPQDPDDARNALIEVRAGAGGDEAGLFGAELVRMYIHFAQRQGWTAEVIEDGSTELGGIKESVLLIQGASVFRKLKYESGVHRVQRVPVTETAGRIHTSTVTVAVLPEAQDVEVDIRREDLRIDTYRASGAGGQHVNRTDSAVRITHLPTGLVVTSQDQRSQIQNREKAMQVLRSRLYDMQRDRQESDYAMKRRAQVGTGDRSERIRTYNFPQGRVTDHRISLTLYRIDEILNGDLDELIDALTLAEQTRLLNQEDA